MATAHVWYRILNCGFRLPAGAGTDAMANFASLRGPVGMNRVYVRTGAPLDQRRLLDSLKAGRSFATNGPLLELTLGGRGLGEELRLPAGEHEVVAQRVAALERADGSSGDRRQRRGGAGDSAHAATARRADVDGDACPCGASGWYLLRARSDRRDLSGARSLSLRDDQSDLRDRRRRAGQLGGGRGVFRAVDRRGWRRPREASTDWNTPDERDRTLELMERARKEFETRKSGG